MTFCEDCGSKLMPGVLFCENCGAKISGAPSVNFSDVSKSVQERGIIYTNLKLLSFQLNKTEEFLNSVISAFILFSNENGVSYELVDVSDKFSDAGTVKEHIAVIRNLVEKNHQKYLFILGSNSVVPSMVWENRASDSGSDKDVSSDLPYSTLDIATPFDGQEYDFSETLRVGRLPNVDLENYFENLKAGYGNAENANSFAMSAEVWQEETKDIFRKLDSSKKVISSPDATKENVKEIISCDTNLFLFNLHGSNQTEFWYGQCGASYPEAIEPNSFSEIKNPYWLAVEACYGAAYEGRIAGKSVLLSALNGKCISFMGSSRIAFGTPRPEGCCADVICGTYLKKLKEGFSAGDSLAIARKALMKGDPSPEDIKTLAEFSLYGDPSVKMKKKIETAGIAKSISIFDASEATVEKSFSRGIRVPLPNIRRAVHLELVKVDQKIADIVESFIYSHYVEFKGIKPKYVKNGVFGNLQAVFELPGSICSKIVAVSFTGNGEIKQLIESK